MSAPLAHGHGPEQYFQGAMGITSYKGKSSNIHIKAKPVAARYLKSQPLHESQEITIENEKCTHFSMKLLVSEELIRTIMSYGGEIEVLEPNELRNIILERIKNMNQLYDLS